ncbi:unnamed protein product [Lota lota]
MSLVDKDWTPAQGVSSPVTTMSSLQCCFSDDQPCQDVSSVVVLYNQTDLQEETRVFLSHDGGLTFSQIHMKSKPNKLVGIFNMPTKWGLAILIKNDDNMINFCYPSLAHEVHTDQHLLLDPLSTLRVIQPAGMRGHLIIWSPHMLLYSPNHGVVLLPVYVNGENGRYTIPPNNITILRVATDDRGFMAVLASEGTLYCGRLGLEAHMIKLHNAADVSQEYEMLFDEFSDLMLFRPRKDHLFGAFDFQKTSLVIDREFSISPCPVEQFYSRTDGDLSFMDMGQSVHFSVVYIPAPICSLSPLATVTDPMLLSVETSLMGDGVTPGGTSKYTLEVDIKQRPYSENLTQGTQKPTPQQGRLSTVVVDLMGRDVVCRRHHPVKAHVFTGCPPRKHVRVHRTMTTCSHGLLTQKMLQDNYSYTIPSNVYDPEGLFRRGSATAALHLNYSIMDYYCPLLVYHDIPWRPQLELWDGGTFLEHVNVDFVLFELNGIYSYRYHDTASSAKCLSQPQDWSSMLARQLSPDPHTAWSQNNYKSCLSSDDPPLSKPLVPYQVLNSQQPNSLTFYEYSGIYLFKVILVDPGYSYCNLTTTFSVYVYGAMPSGPAPLGLMFGLFFTAALGVLIAGFFVSPRKNTETLITEAGREADRAPKVDSMWK